MSSLKDFLGPDLVAASAVAQQCVVASPKQCDLDWKSALLWTESWTAWEIFWLPLPDGFSCTLVSIPIPVMSFIGNMTAANRYLWIPSNRASSATAPPTYGHGWAGVNPNPNCASCLCWGSRWPWGRRTAGRAVLKALHPEPSHHPELPVGFSALSLGVQIFPPVLSFSVEGIFFF